MGKSSIRLSCLHVKHGLVLRACYARPVPKKLTLEDAARMGGHARADSLTDKERTAIATKAGQAGGPARAKALTKKRRSEIARAAAKARWGKM